jgi:hypothetical protein
MMVECLPDEYADMHKLIPLKGDPDFFKRMADAEEEDSWPATWHVRRADIWDHADDGQHYRITMLDLQDEFKIVVLYPNGELETIWELRRFRADDVA